MNARTIIDYSPELSITNLESLPRGTGARLLLVVESPYPNEYAAKRWLRKMPETTARCNAVVRFGALPTIFAEGGAR